MGYKASQFLDRFTPKQHTAFDAMFVKRYVLYGGARGGGKSYWLRWSLLLFLVYLHKVHSLRNVHVGLFCEDYPSLKDRQISKIDVEFPRALGEVKESKTGGLGFYLNEANGGGVISLRNLDDPAKYLSSEFAAIGVDELTKSQRSVFDVLRGSLRWPGVEHSVFLGATNPGGIGHQWVKQLWIDSDFPSELRPLADQFVFVQSLPSDNPHLPQSYWQELNSLPADLRRAWVEGDWTMFAGQAFSAWRADRHVVEPFDIPRNWPRWRAVDWGYSAPFACLWLAKNPDTGRVIVYRELYATELTDRSQARLLSDMTPPDESISITYADPAMWTAKTYAGLVTSSADEYLVERVPLTRADNDRLSGKRKIDRLLADLPDGKPGLQVFSTCRNFVRTFPALPYSETRPEDVDTDAEDHAYDALRYALTNTQQQRVQQPQRRPSVFAAKGL